MPASPCTPRVLDQSGRVLHRHDALCGTRRTGDNCALDALCFCLGDERILNAAQLADISQELNGKRLPPSIGLIAQALLQKTPFSLEKLGKMSAHDLLSMQEGIYFVRTQVKEGNELKFHFIGVDAWRRLIFDNDVDPTCRFCLYDENDMASSSAATTLLQQMGTVSIADVYVVKILLGCKRKRGGRKNKRGERLSSQVRAGSKASLSTCATFLLS